MHSQKGMTLVFSIPIIIVGMLLSIGVITFMNYASTRSAIQGAIDLSLINAAQEICSSKACWDQSRAAFLDSLEGNLKNIDLSFVNLNQLDIDGHQVTEWENEGVKLSLERIRFKIDDEVESLEKSWQEEHPGVPVGIAYYGLKASFETKLKSFAENILPLSLVVRAKGTVAAGPLRTPCVAPFAIKACALLNPDGDLAKENICDADRRFGPSNGYCREGEQCLNVSEFDYDPLSQNGFMGSQAYPDNFFPRTLVKYDPPKDEACFFATPRYGAFNSSSKDQNVIGIPGSSITANESLIRSVISDEGGCVSAGVGQPFQILHEGLNDADSAQIIWDQISNRNVGGVTDSFHRPLFELTDRDEININENLIYKEPVRGTDPVDACNNILRWKPYQAFGAFSSFRSDFGMWKPYNDRSIRLPSGDLVCPWQDDKFYSPFWQVVVPVIADVSSNAVSCGGMLGSTRDPLISKSSQYEIVGFTKLNIFDVGHGAAKQPDRGSLNEEAEECSKLNLHQNPDPDEFPNLSPFSFTDQKGDSPKGVQVRARIACGSKTFGGASAAMGEAVPVLIE